MMKFIRLLFLIPTVLLCCVAFVFFLVALFAAIALLGLGWACAYIAEGE